MLASSHLFSLEQYLKFSLWSRSYAVRCLTDPGHCFKINPYLKGLTVFQFEIQQHHWAELPALERGKSYSL